MNSRTIRIIKPNQAAISVAVPMPEVHEMDEAEIRAKRVLIVQNWIEERRDNDTKEKNGIRREIIEWRKFKVTLPGKKIAISAITA